MSDPFIAEIRIFPLRFAPKGWAWCDGQIVPIAQFTALFSLLGATYGGNGTSTFALPDLQGRAPMHVGQGPGLTARSLGESGGVASVTLTANEIPAHTHELRASSASARQGSLTSGIALASSVGGALYQSNTGSGLASLSPDALASAGGGEPHNNMQPYLACYFCIALQGVYPQRP